MLVGRARTFPCFPDQALRKGDYPGLSTACRQRRARGSADEGGRILQPVVGPV